MNDITIDELIKIIKQSNNKLRVMIVYDGLCYPITKNEIKTSHVIPTKDWTEGKCYIETDEDTKRAVKVLVIG